MTSVLHLLTNQLMKYSEICYSLILLLTVVTPEELANIGVVAVQQGAALSQLVQTSDGSGVIKISIRFSKIAIQVCRRHVNKNSLAYQ